MLCSEFIKQNEKQLSQEIGTARLDILVLLEDATGKDRGWLLANPDYELPAAVVTRLHRQLARRLKHEPLAYIRGKQEFYGREFIVSPDTLTPRPETETMIDLLIEHIDRGCRKIIDIGTGSGCIIISAALEFRKDTAIELIGLDISLPALEIAKQNDKKLGTNVRFQHFDLLNDELGKFIDNKTVILANLPYVPDSHTINQAAMQEPAFAIFGGPDGLDLYRELFRQISSNAKASFVLTESLPFQHPELRNIALGSGYEQIVEEDFIQTFSSSSKE